MTWATPGAKGHKRRRVWGSIWKEFVGRIGRIDHDLACTMLPGDFFAVIIIQVRCLGLIALILQILFYSTLLQSRSPPTRVQNAPQSGQNSRVCTDPVFVMT